MRTSWPPDVDPAPGLLVVPPDVESLDEAHAAIEMWEHYSAKTLDPSQRLVVEVLMATRSDGRWAAATTGRAMARQNGKGDEIEVVELWGLVQRGERILHTVHDAVLLTTQAQQRLLSVLESSPDLRSRITRIWRGTGQQMIELSNDATIWYRTRSGGGGRGVDDVDRVVVDEAQHALDEHIDAISPTLLANPNGQLNAMGTSGLPGRSAWWWSQRRRALGDDPGRFGWVEHTAEVVHLDDTGNVVQEPVDVDDRSLWRATNPSVLAGRGQGMEFLEEQLRRLGPAGFAREHLCVWAPPPVVDTDALIPFTEWTAGGRPITAMTPVASGQPVLCWSVSFDGKSSSIGMGWGSIADASVMVLDTGLAIRWLPGRLVELVAEWDPVAVGCNNAGPTAAQVPVVLDALKAAGVEDRLHLFGLAEWKAACGGFLAAVREQQLVHLDGQGPLDTAVAGVRERRLGDGFAWDGRASDVDLSPLEAVTGARALLPTERAAATVAPTYAF